MRRSALFISLALLSTQVASAATFSDVPKTSPYYEAIMALADAGVITGNPDGTYRPLNPLNRVSVLKMAYKAAGREPAVSSGNCFPKEFAADAWFAPYVCDALTRKFVSGYSDGTFRPNNVVTLGEALKMMYTVLEIPAPAVTGYDVSLLPFRLSQFHWAAPYVYSAFGYDMLPMPGQPADLYTVDDPIDRGQAALLLFHAKDVRANLLVNESSSSSAASESSSESSESSSSSSSVAIGTDATATVPWSESSLFEGGEPRVYRFHLKEDGIVHLEAGLTGMPKEKISCRLYRLEDDEVSNEFYVGIEEGPSCYLHLNLEAGKYQIELSSTVKDAGFRVEVTDSMQTDSNDGLHDAVLIPLQKFRSGTLLPNDLEDWYGFSVPYEQELMVEMTTNGSTQCSIYPWDNVELSSFENPVCNKMFLYPAGTYYLRLVHGSPRASKETYTLTIRSK